MKARGRNNPTKNTPLCVCGTVYSARCFKISAQNFRKYFSDESISGGSIESDPIGPAYNQVFVKRVGIYFEQFKSRNASFAGFRFITILSLLGLCASSVFADNYQFQVDGTYWQIDGGDYDYEIKDSTVALTYYLTDVDDSVGPLAKASFLNKASSVKAYHSRTLYDDDYSSHKYSVNGMQGSFVTDNDLVFQVEYYRESYKDCVANCDIDSYSLGGGLYLNDNSLVRLKYQLIKDDHSYNVDIYQADYEQVISFYDDTYVGVTGTIGYLDQDYVGGQAYVGGTVDYYFNSRLSVGAALHHTHDEETGYGIKGQYFFNNHFGLMGAYQITDSYDHDNAKIMTLNIIGRF